MVRQMADKRKSRWYAGGLAFECVGCGGCCSGPQQGFIWINGHERKLLAEYLKISDEELKAKYLKRVGMCMTVIEERLTNDCIFLVKSGGQKKCAIYPVRPNQCRTWPFWTNNLASPDDWNVEARTCDGMNRGRFYSFEEIEQIRKSKKWWENNEQ